MEFNDELEFEYVSLEYSVEDSIKVLTWYLLILIMIKFFFNC